MIGTNKLKMHTTGVPTLKKEKKDLMTYIYGKLISAWKNPGMCCLECGSFEGENYETSTLPSEIAGPVCNNCCWSIIFVAKFN